MKRWLSSHGLAWLVLVGAMLTLGGTAQASLEEAWIGYADGWCDGEPMGQYAAAPGARAVSSMPGYSPNSRTPHYLAGYNAGFSDVSYYYGNSSYYGTSFPYYLFSRNPAPDHEAMTARLLTQGGTQRVLRSFRQLHWLKPEPSAGDLFTNVAVSAGGSYAVVDDNALNGNGHDRTSEALVALGVGERLTLGLGLSQDNYWINGNHRDYEETVNAADLLLAADLTDALSLGAFLNVSRADIETETTKAFSVPGDRFDRYGAGLMVSYEYRAGHGLQLGLSSALASLNKHTPADLFDNEDSAWLIQSDVSRTFFERVTLDAYGSYFTLLDRDPARNAFTPDGTYWTWGVDAEYRVSRGVKVRVGGSTNASDDDRHEKRLNTALTMSF